MVVALYIYTSVKGTYKVSFFVLHLPLYAQNKITDCAEMMPFFLSYKIVRNFRNDFFVQKRN